MTAPTLKARDCRWIKVPGASDARGSVNFLELGMGLDFQPKRLFWRYAVTNPLALFCLLTRTSTLTASWSP